jgi:transcriptional regulator with XRE-family HTH domain
MQDTLARKLRVLRAERGLTLREAAQRTGVDKDTLSKLERGIRHPHDVTISRLAKGYDVPVEELLEERALAGTPGKAEAPYMGPTVYDEVEVLASIPYEEGGQAEAWEDALRVAKEARSDYDVVLSGPGRLALRDDGECVEVVIEIPAEAEVGPDAARKILLGPTRRLRRRV